MRQHIMQQPQALRDMIAFYARGDARSILTSLPVAAPLLTGMGASLHAAQIAAAHLQQLGVPAAAVEAIDLFYYGRALLDGGRPLIFVSQSGTSAEVEPILAALPREHPLLAVTNNLQSPLASRAQTALPLYAGPEQGVATRTYLNTLALLWLLARRWASASGDDDVETLARLADACAALLADADAIAGRWLAALGDAATLVFLGHGPHAATARQAAMMLAERARLPAIGTGVGAFRHGPIEIAQPGVGAVVFASPGQAARSALALAEELRGYGGSVLVVEQGRTRDVGQPSAPDTPFDEFLAPALDIIPVQLFADALARSRGVAAEFRYLGKGARVV